MVDTIYIEKEIADHELVAKVVSKYPKAERVAISHYGEVFNAAKQNFRLQKQSPNLILAQKKGNMVMPTPAQYETGGGAHYYFSHMLNCVYDCRYCFLQGMLRSANYVLFVNYDEFASEIRSVAQKHKDDDRPAWFFSGYDCDSLAYEPVTGFAEHFLPAFDGLENAVLELRTKSTQIRSLLNAKPIDNVVVAYSLSSERVAKSVEHGAPSLRKRIEAMQRLQDAGWRIGLRFDPIVWHKDYLQDYRDAVDLVFSQLNTDEIDSVTLGGFRLPKGFHKIIQRLYPEDWLLNTGLDEEQGMIVYRQEIENQALSEIGKMCEEYIESNKLFAYASYNNDPKKNEIESLS